MNVKSINIKQIIFSILWISIAVCTIILSVSAVKRQDGKSCKGVDVNISGVENNFFIDKNDVLKIVNELTYNKAIGSRISSFDLLKIEQSIKRDVWINNAELFFDNNDILKISVSEREPVARIFTRNNKTFYIDSSLMMLPLSDKFSARLPVFTNFPSDAKVLTDADSMLLRSIEQMSVFIQGDSFLMGMIDQVDINAAGTFELTPKIGNQLIIFGDGNNIETKLKKLKLFYKQVIAKAGWNKYRTIDLQYDGQIVAKMTGKEDISADSLKTIQLMDFMAKTAAAQAADSTRRSFADNVNNSVDATLIQQSVERDEGPDMTEDNYPATPASPVPASAMVVKPVDLPKPKPAASLVKKPNSIAVSSTLKNPVTKKPIIRLIAKKPAPVKKPVIAPVKKPKIVMPNKNEY